MFAVLQLLVRARGYLMLMPTWPSLLCWQQPIPQITERISWFPQLQSRLCSLRRPH